MFKFLKDRFSKIRQALSKTRSVISGRIMTLFQKPFDEETFDSLEQIFYEADLGTACSEELVAQTKLFLRKNREASTEEILSFLRSSCLEMMEVPPKVAPKKGTPQVILIVGVNGSGKTTSIAKLANILKEEGQSVMLAAGDTFRAAAIDQLATWAERLKIPIIKSTPGGDPAAVAFDAVTAAKARGIDTLIIDTAGRLQNKTDLMRELEKVQRVIQKVIPDAPHQTLLVLDATTGQNAVDQADVFHTFTPLTGIVLAKLDGSAKGGIALSIYKKLGIPVLWVGVGEKIDDLIPFDKESYLDALFSGK
ncbi:MAG: signal recognition particle-docking protein FtsY [Verrucomicrobia bacterium]|nr:signal recognition particle-docking protein FtsY [Verrucomicrobiota bacterium]